MSEIMILKYFDNQDLSAKFNLLLDYCWIMLDNVG
jgi:hypothetical protein